MQNIPGFDSFLTFQKKLVKKIAWPYSSDQESIYHWRALILFSILLGGLILGSVAFIATAALLIKSKAWGLIIFDVFAAFLGFALLFVHRIRFEIRAAIACISFYVIGLSVILSFGVLSGGPAWLFSFAVLAGVLLGNQAAFSAIFVNTVSLSIIGFLISTGKIGTDLPFFNTPQAMIAAGVNFIVLNAIISISVSALMKGLNAGEKRYRLIAENVADVIWTMDMNLNLTYISPSILQMQGYTPGECLKMPLAKIFTPESYEKVIKIFETKLVQIETKDDELWEPDIFELEQYCKDGTIIWTNVHARVLKGLDNKPKGILGITRDITERKKNVKEKIKAQVIAGEQKKLALVGQIAGKMAHDFNNVLGIIMGQAELALLDCKDGEMKKAFDLIFNQTIRGKNLTKNLIAFAKSSQPRQEFFFINQKIDFVLNLVKNDLEGITVIKENLDEVELMADPGMIEHALVNLLQNSIHALSRRENPKIIIRSSSLDGEILFEIEDNGCGIPEEHLLDIFEPSFTLKGSKDATESYQNGIKGTGYGLANVKKYIELHRGKIFVESKPDTGTKVTICLPVIQKGLTKKEKTSIDKAKRYSKKHILIVEDESALSEVQYTILSQEPFKHTVDVAPNGPVAIDLIEKNRYDLVSLDYILPGKINGKDVYDHIRRLNPSIPVLFLSGNIEFLESIETLKKKDPNVDHLSKPCRNIEYVNCLNHLLEKRSS